MISVRLLRSSFVSVLYALAALDIAAVVPTFRKTTLDEHFFAEGAAFGDLNGDGQLDAVAGPYWYAGPDFTERHEIYSPVVVDPLKYSENFCAFTYDFNGDGWTDVLVIGFPGAAATWFENPGKKTTSWTRHLAFSSVDNESPVFARLFPQEPPVLLCSTGGRFGYAQFDPKDPMRPWTFHAVTPPGPWQRFTHGLGFGDVNGLRIQIARVEFAVFPHRFDVNDVASIGSEPPAFKLLKICRGLT